MRDLVQQLSRWRTSGRRFAVATVIRTWRSAPRAPGAMMAVDEYGTVVGSVSGGCVEAAVYDLAGRVIETGRPELAGYGVSDDDALAVGLTCGGTIDVIITPGDGWPDDLAALVRSETPVALATVVSESPDLGRRLIVSSADGDQLARAAAGLLAAESSAVVTRDDGLEVFVQTFPARPLMIIFGTGDFAAALVGMGRFLGYRVVVCDARPAFTSRRRFEGADELIIDQPDRYLARTDVDERTVLCVLTHDPKFDVPLILAALRTPARYIGLMGSRRTRDDRIRRLKQEGVTDEEINRIAAPVGLDLGASTPEETAVAIAAEIIAAHRGGSGRRLRDSPGPIHPTYSEVQERQ